MFMKRWPRVSISMNKSRVFVILMQINVRVCYFNVGVHVANYSNRSYNIIALFLKIYSIVNIDKHQVQASKITPKH